MGIILHIFIGFVLVLIIIFIIQNLSKKPKDSILDKTDDIDLES